MNKELDWLVEEWSKDWVVSRIDRGYLTYHDIRELGEFPCLEKDEKGTVYPVLKFGFATEDESISDDVLISALNREITSAMNGKTHMLIRENPSISYMHTLTGNFRKIRCRILPLNSSDLKP